MSEAVGQFLELVRQKENEMINRTGHEMRPNYTNDELWRGKIEIEWMGRSIYCGSSLVDNTILVKLERLLEEELGGRFKATIKTDEDSELEDMAWPT